MLLGNFLHGSFSALFAGRGTQNTACVLNYLSRHVCIVNSLGRQRESLPLVQRAGMFAVRYNK